MDGIRVVRWLVSEAPVLHCVQVGNRFHGQSPVSLNRIHKELGEFVNGECNVSASTSTCIRDLTV